MITRYIVLMLLCSSCAWGQSLTGKELGLVRWYKLDTTNWADSQLNLAQTNGVRISASIVCYDSVSPTEGNGCYSNMSYGGISTQTKDLFDKQTNVTIAFKFKYNGAGLTVSHFRYLVAALGGWSGTYTRLFGIYFDGSATTDLYFSVHRAYWGPVYSWKDLSAGKWYSIAGTYDGFNLRLYIDGVEKSMAAVTNAIAQQDTASYIGIGQAQSELDWATYQIDDVSLWSRALSPAEVRDLAANKPLPQAGGNRYKQANRYQINR